MSFGVYIVHFCWREIYEWNCCVSGLTCILFSDILPGKGRSDSSPAINFLPLLGMSGKEREMTQVNGFINMLMKDLLADTWMVFTTLRVVIYGMLF